MQKFLTGKVIVLLAALIVLIGVAVKFLRPGRPASPAVPVAVQTRNAPPSPSHVRSSETPVPVLEAHEPAAIDFDWRLFLSGTNFLPPLPREAIEKYVERHRRSAESLLAAFHAERAAHFPWGDRGDFRAAGMDYLKEAATNFPNDPKIQLAVLASNAFPEQQRNWLDSFKASAPGNSLANYLSAREYFKTGQSDAAVAELLEAARKPEFKTYAMESRLEEEQLNMEAGRSAVQSRLSAVGWTADHSQELARPKALAQDMASLQQQYLSAGDPASAEHLAELGLAMATQISNGDNGKSVLNRLQGMAIESIVLQYLDPNTSYDFLGGRTPAQQQAQNKETRASIRALTQSRNEIFPNLTEAELLSYTERQRIYGDIEAMRWLQQQHAAAAPNGGN